MASTGLLAQVAIGFRVRQRGQTSFSVSAELPYWGIPHVS
jgi:hypothetical protein